MPRKKLGTAPIVRGAGPERKAIFFAAYDRAIREGKRSLEIYKEEKVLRVTAARWLSSRRDPAAAALRAQKKNLARRTGRPIGRPKSDRPGYVCSRCRQRPFETKEEHYATCRKFRCGRCGKLPSESKKEHYAKCKSFECARCRKRPRESKEQHYAKCKGSIYQCSYCGARPSEPKREHYAKCEGSKYKCSRCGARPSEPQAEHYAKCTGTGPGYRCHRCDKRPKVPSQEHRATCGARRYFCSHCLVEHSSACTTRSCPLCHKLFTETNLDEHLEHCLFRWCPQCNVPIHKDQYEVHLRVCSQTYCDNCRTQVPLDDVQEHKSECSARRGSDRIWGPEVAARLFAPNTCFPICSRTMSTMRAWVGEPLNTAIVDFEFWRVWTERIFPGSPVKPLQLAIANADGEWIIPVSTINYNVSIRWMHELGRTIISPYGIPLVYLVLCLQSARQDVLLISIKVP